MAANLTDKLQKTGASTVTTLAAPGKALGATSLTVGSTTNYPTDTGITIAIRVVDTDGELVAGTYTEWTATVSSGTSFAIDATPVYGSDQVYAAGSTTQVFVPVSSASHNKLVDGLLVSLDQDGTLKAGAVDNAAVLADDVVETAKITDKAATLAKINGGSTDGALRTDASGNVTVMPSCEFFAYLTSDWTPAVGGNNNIFASGASELYDTGNNVNSTGVFTAPANGIYTFSGSIFRDNATDFTIGFVVNMSGTSRIFYGGHSTSAANVKRLTAAITLKLAAGDTLYIETVYGAGTAFKSGVANTWFSGARIR